MWFDVQKKGARSKWGLTSKVQNPGSLKGKIAVSGGLVIEMKKLEFTGFHKPPDEHMA